MRKIAVLLIVIMFFTVKGYAQSNISAVPDNAQRTVDVFLNAEVPYIRSVNILIVPKGTLLHEVNFSGDADSRIKYLGTFMTDSKGMLNTVVPLDGFSSGEYTMFAGVQSLSQVISADFVYTNPYEAADAVEAINDIKNSLLPKGEKINQIILLISEKYLNLGIESEMVNMPDGLTLMEKIVESLISMADFPSPQVFAEKYRQVYIIEKINEIDDAEVLKAFIMEYKDSLALDSFSSVMNTYYNSREIQTPLMNILQDMTFSSFEDIRKAFHDWTVLLAMKYSQVWSEGHNYFTSMNDYIKAELSNLSGNEKNIVFSALIGHNNGINTIAELKSAYTARVADLYKTSSNTTQQSSSPKGGGAVSAPVYVNIPKIENVNPEPKENVSFTDLHDYEWAKEAIYYLASRGIVKGTGEDEFSPNQEITRAQLAKIVTITFGIPQSVDKITFSDIDRSHWAYDYVCDVYQSGAMSNVSDMSFAPDMKLTREQFVSVVFRVSSFTADTSEYQPFTDQNDISAYAVAAVRAFRAAGIINGMPDGSFYPKSHITRAEAAKILHKVIQGGRI